jgi:hypothetical protein
MGKKNALVFRTRQTVISSQWQVQWENLYLHIKTYNIRLLIQKFLETQGLLINTLFLRQTHEKLWIQVQAFGPHRRTKKFFTLGQERLKKPRLFSRLVQSIQTYVEVTQVQMRLRSFHLPIAGIGWSQRKFKLNAFRRYKDKPYFVESLQVLTLLCQERLTALYLAKFIYAQVRRNPERLAFTLYLGRLFQWFVNTPRGKENIRGLRIEVKGRFNPGERRRKSLVSLGQINFQEFRINPKNSIDYADLAAITKFGALNVQVWLVLHSQTPREKAAGFLERSGLEIIPGSSNLRPQGKKIFSSTKLQKKRSAKLS